MRVLKYILMVIYAIVCVVLTVLVLKQSKDDNGASGTIVGASTNNFYEKNKGRTREGKMKTATIALIITFAVLTLALGILYLV